MVVQQLDVKNDIFRPQEDNEDLLDPQVPYLSAIGIGMELSRYFVIFEGCLIWVIYLHVEELNSDIKRKQEIPMARHGHFWLLAACPCPYLYPCLKNEMERVSIKYSVRDPLLVPLGTPRTNWSIAYPEKTLSQSGCEDPVESLESCLYQCQLAVPSDYAVLNRSSSRISYLEICSTSPNCKVTLSQQRSPTGRLGRRLAHATRLLGRSWRGSRSAHGEGRGSDWLHAVKKTRTSGLSSGSKARVRLFESGARLRLGLWRHRRGWASQTSMDDARCATTWLSERLGDAGFADVSLRSGRRGGSGFRSVENGGWRGAGRRALRSSRRWLCDGDAASGDYLWRLGWVTVANNNGRRR
ncbi:Retrovirus-related Pol polyprotein from transposon TNT 1-94 [Cucumis melo var. makuwa]|uniref:Retrovirus-related Pol polyprotein from transposon TNT 1-94 n=1 Tax=Cucumis melo var. makuwa TaxID=1194695 RepID=A0A5A7TE57_CUCMM|nr:Retrovirus-related Pol polyprotein from transposon TNT 1-94 [Cucumis melo var. makuwa]TYK06314.1 Retrovirus-related Pol polyprotein from transposon TNT 1-94 [Cucumis melo var. makuwa]